MLPILLNAICFVLFGFIGVQKIRRKEWLLAAIYLAAAGCWLTSAIIQYHTYTLIQVRHLLQ